VNSVNMFFICGSLCLFCIVLVGNLSEADPRMIAALAFVGCGAYITGWAVRHLSDPRMRKIRRHSNG
jgi:hypothetical protein